MFNPCEPTLVATANSKLGIHLWDIRKPKEYVLINFFILNIDKVCGMCVVCVKNIQKNIIFKNKKI